MPRPLRLCGTPPTAAHSIVKTLAEEMGLVSEQVDAKAGEGMSISIAATMDALLRPRSLAIGGASSDPRGLGGRPLQIVRQHGFSGAIHLVKPPAASLGGGAARAAG